MKLIGKVKVKPTCEAWGPADCQMHHGNQWSPELELGMRRRFEFPNKVYRIRLGAATSR